MRIMQELIQKKRDGHSLTKEDWQWIVSGFVEGQLPDYQLAALLMAVYFRHLSERETGALLQSMVASGAQFEWESIADGRAVVDKHSTGGVGDKTSMIILPLLIEDGFVVPMIAGRGLGHTGGTLDKLESIPGCKTSLPLETLQNIVKDAGGVMAAQTDDLVPADKKLYALRDVTATVEQIGLIVASILSKKIAAGVKNLVLDVKYGSGAFMRELAQAKELATQLVKVGRHFGAMEVSAALTNMDEPLGRSVGNALEIVECLDVLSGAGPRDTRELSLQLAARVSCMARKEKWSDTHTQHYRRLANILDSGRALECFYRVMQLQGASRKALERSETEWIQEGVKDVPVLSERSGFVGSIQTRDVGLALIALGGGRVKKEDRIHPRVGFFEMKKVGEYVNAGEPLCWMRVNAHHEKSAQHVEERIRNSYTLQESEVTQPVPLLHSWIDR